MEPAALIDEALRLTGGYSNLVDRTAYKERTLKRVRSGELELSSKLKGMLERIIREASPLAINGSVKEKAAGYGNIYPELINMRKIRVYSLIQAGLATTYETLPESWEDEIDYDGPDEKAFALRIAGDSMEPRFPPGTIITLSPAKPAVNGDLVAACIRNEGPLFKLFHHTGDGKTITLSSYNPSYPDIVLEREKFHWIYKAVRATRNL